MNGDQTSGSNTMPISGNAMGPAMAGTWSGRYIVERCDGTGSVQDYFCSSRGFFRQAPICRFCSASPRTGPTYLDRFRLVRSPAR